MLTWRKAPYPYPGPAGKVIPIDRKFLNISLGQPDWKTSDTTSHIEIPGVICLDGLIRYV